jgi:hypothetical protein
MVFFGASWRGTAVCVVSGVYIDSCGFNGKITSTGSAVDMPSTAERAGPSVFGLFIIS